MTRPLKCARCGEEKDIHFYDTKHGWHWLCSNCMGNATLWDQPPQRHIDELGRMLYGQIMDDPECDCTPFQHPAFSRGETYSVKIACRKINEILDGKDNGSGVYGDADFELLRRRLLRLLSNEAQP